MSLDGKLQNKYVGKAISIKSWSFSGSHFRHFTECSWGILHVFNRFTYIFSVALAASVSARELDMLARQNRLFFFYVSALESHLLLSHWEVWGSLLFCTSSLSLAGRGVRKVRMPARSLMWCPVTGWDLVGRHVPLCPRHKLLPIPSPSHITGQRSHISRLGDARARTSPITKGAHWLTGDASPKSTWLWATETKGWG